MSTARTDPAWIEVSRLFDAVLDLPPAEADDFLAVAASNSQVRQEVRDLLDCEARADGFLDHPAFEAAAHLLLDDTELVPGTAVGSYRIVRPLGAGGMGSVFLAERHDTDFYQCVALKVMHAELASPELRQMFRRERQILATLEHPAIARLIDGGELPDGRPYLVMELVAGQPLDRYCAVHRLTPQQRLDLFVQTCDAVQAAHNRRIVHRDLKPGNILVDAEGRLRLVDFGTAGLLPPSTSQTAPPDRDAPDLADGPEKVLFSTPAYRSPEVACGAPVTTAVDIYSLGVVLSRLLEKPGRLEGPRVDRDLDAIIARACAQDPSERYPTVNALGQDIRRYRSNRPIQARQRSPAGRLRLLARRHPWATLAAALVLVLTAGFIATLRAERDRATRALDRAELAGDFLIELFAVADPGALNGGPLTAQELLDRGSHMLDRGSLDPPLRLRIINGLARRHLALGQISEAQSLLGSISALLTPEPRGEMAADAVESMGLLGETALRAGRWEEAAQHLELALHRARSAPGDPARVRVRLLVDLAETHVRRGALELAAPALAEARQHAERRLREQDSELARLHAITGFYYHELGDLEAAQAAHQQALALAIRHGGRGQPAVADALGDLALIDQQTGNNPAAYRKGREALEIQKALFAPGHPALAISYHNLGSLALHNGDFAAARDLLLQALEHEEQLAAASPLAPAAGQRLLANALLALGELDTAERWARSSLGAAQGNTKAHRHAQLKSLFTLARILDAGGHGPAVEATMRQGVEICERTEPPALACGRLEKHLAAVQRQRRAAPSKDFS